MPTFKSGAFVQQCYSSHPLCLKFKTLNLPDRVVVTCTNCDMRHRLIIGTLTTRAPEESLENKQGTSHMSQCATDHPAELRVSAVDVLADAVRLRCGECQRTYNIAVSAFETYRKDV